MNITLTLGEWINEQLHKTGITTNTYVGEGIAAAIFFALTILVGWIVYHIFERHFTKWAQKTETTLDDEIIKNIKKPAYFFVVLIGSFYAINQLSMLDPYTKEIAQIYAIAEILLVAFIVTRVINVFLSWYAEKLEKQKKKKIDNRILSVFKKFLFGIIYLIGFVLILYALKIDLSGVVIGLGVGGIAIAFALQNILSDVFSAFSIYFDRPFEVGDYIVVGNNGGTVTKIGMKSTRMQLLQGEEMIVSNREITSGSVRNYKKMTKRRVEFTIRANQNTSLNKLKKIPTIVENTIKTCEPAEFDMIHLREIGPFAYNFEVIYYIKTGDYHIYLDTQEKINYALKEAFEKEGIEFGFQGRTGSPA
ncbi:MAG: mechanosensitive ion channel family protein [Euryarchaeota archaeon]|nr:mechanosensitive ion channel family protein [Euryarchaeota archaeon]